MDVIQHLLNSSWERTLQDILAFVISQRKSHSLIQCASILSHLLSTHCDVFLGLFHRWNLRITVSKWVSICVAHTDSWAAALGTLYGISWPCILCPKGVCGVDLNHVSLGGYTGCWTCDVMRTRVNRLATVTHRRAQYESTAKRPALRVLPSWEDVCLAFIRVILAWIPCILFVSSMQSLSHKLMLPYKNLLIIAVPAWAETRINQITLSTMELSKRRGK